MSKKLNFFDGAESSTTPTIGNIAAADLVQYANDAAYEAANVGAPTTGNLYYNTTDDVIRWYNGTAWQTVSDSADHSYDNASSGLTATNTQAAIDEVEGRVDTAETNISTNSGDITNLEQLSGESGASAHAPFSGTTIPNSSSTRGALQSLETEVETKLDASEKGAVNGVAELDGSGKVPAAQLPTNLMEYQGDWNASTNSPALANTDTGVQGNVYRVTVAGTTDFGAGNITFAVGDWAYNNGTTWEKSIETTLPDTDSLPEGATNLYNQTHTGEVTGATALTVASTAITNKTEVTPEAGDFILFSDTSDSGNLKKLDAADLLGGGSGQGGINYVTNPDAEVDATGWTSYDDAAAIPVDGAGGSPVSTLTRTTSASLLVRGDGSFSWLGLGGTGAGEGKATDITIDKRDLNGQTLYVSFDYRDTDGDLTTGYFKVYVYDIDNATLLGTVDNGLDGDVEGVGGLGAFGTFTGKFQTTDSENYRIMIHTVSTADTVNSISFDNVKVGPDTLVPGAIITEWTSFTPSWTNGGTTSRNNGFWRRVGDSMEIASDTLWTGAGSAGSLYYDIPGGKSVDSNKVPHTGYLAGVGSWFDSPDEKVAQGFVDVGLNGTFVIQHAEGGNALQGNEIANGDTVRINITVPIDGWSSGAMLSTTENLFSTTRLEVEGTLTNSFSSTSFAYNLLTYPTVVTDNQNIYNSSTGVVTIPKDGEYLIEAGYNVSLSGNLIAGNKAHIGVYVNSTDTKKLNVNYGNGNFSNLEMYGSTIMQLQKGDLVQIYQQKAGTETITAGGDARLNRFALTRLSDFSTFSVHGETEYKELTRNVNFNNSGAAANAYTDWDGGNLTLGPGTWDLGFQAKIFAAWQTGSSIGVSPEVCIRDDSDDSVLSGTQCGSYGIQSNANDNFADMYTAVTQITITESTDYKLSFRSNVAATASLLTLNGGDGRADVLMYARRVK